MEIVNPEIIVINTASGPRKIALSSLRAPRRQKAEGAAGEEKEARSKPLFTVPYYWEAREFLRTKLIGQKVSVVVDYIQPASDNFPEKVCGTVMSGGINIAEALISKGLATVQRHRQVSLPFSGGLHPRCPLHSGHTI